MVAGERETKRQMLIYTALLLPLAPLPWILGATGAVYGVASIALGLAFLGTAWRVWREDGAATGHRAAKQMFGFSILYPFALFALMIVDRAAAQPGGDVMAARRDDAAETGQRDDRRDHQGLSRREGAAGKNLAVLFVLIAFVVLVYVVAIVRMGGS